MAKVFDISDLVKVAARVRKTLDEKLLTVKGQTGLAADITTLLDLIDKLKAESEGQF